MDTSPVAWTRRDTWTALTLTLLAAVLRLWNLGDLGITHFDEGGYAMSALAIHDAAVPRDLYPLQHFLAPPVVFGLAGWLMRLLGTTSELALIGISLGAGILTVPLLYVIGQRWLGRSAGVGAALLLALSDYHILYSRTGLTDGPFVFLFLLAIWLYGLADDRESLWIAVLAGLATGLAWNTKYHGWLAGVIAGAALAPRLLARDTKSFLSGTGRVLLAAGIAMLVYLPWYLYVEGQEGGYARLVAEHSGFLKPFMAHKSTFVQLRSQLYLDGWFARIAPALALGGAWFALSSDVRRRTRGLALWIAALLAAGVFVGETVTATLLAVVGVLLAFRSHTRGHWLLLAYLGAFTVLTPLYTPYNRLLMPWLLAVFLFAGAALTALAREPAAGTFAAGSFGPRRAVVVLAVALIGVIATGIRPTPPIYAPTTGFRTASAELAELARGSEPVLVIGEPAVVFYLRRAGVRAEHLDHADQMADEFEPGESLILVIGVYGRLMGEVEQWLEEHPGSGSELARLSVPLGPIRLAEDYRPANKTSLVLRPEAEHDLQVYRITLPQ